MKFIQYFIYLISSIRIKLFRGKILKTHAFSIPIISIGNIAMGGTGKTPMCIEIFSILQDKMHNVQPFSVTDSS